MQLGHADLVVVLMMLGCLATMAYALRSLHRQSHGREAHAHDDGTIHSHHRGAVPHTHRPRFGDPVLVRERRNLR